MDFETVKWLIGTGVALAGVAVGYLQLKKQSQGRIEKSTVVSSSLPASSPKSAPSLSMLKRRLDIAKTMHDPAAHQKAREEIVDLALEAGELKFALEAMKDMPDKERREIFKAKIMAAHK